MKAQRPLLPTDPDRRDAPGLGGAAASALAALDAYQPGVSPEAGEQALTQAHDGTLDIAQTFRNAGLASVVSAGEAAEPGAQPSLAGESSPPSVTPLTGMTLTRPFTRPQARFNTPNTG